ncbi:MAG: hypothetical protein Q9222_004599 [Ikaeria aurantiellina]
MTTGHRALQDLPINTHGTPNTAKISVSHQVNLKRPLDDAELQSTEFVSPGASAQHLERDLEVAGDELGEGNTQETGSHTISTCVDSDPEGDTINTQQTAATELSTSIISAETLRLRLRFALFKVQTNQVNVPLSQIRFPTHHSLGSRTASSPSSASIGSAKPHLLPAPVLKPSVRPKPRASQTQIPSSPPASGENSPQSFRTDTLSLSRTQLAQQMSSPPDSYDGERGRSQAEDRALNSSAVKGHAAISLLDLRGDRR